MASKTSTPTSSSKDLSARKIVKLPLKDTSRPADTFKYAQEIVYVVVGPEKTRFGLHKDFLCSTSPYFKAAFSGGFHEAVLGEVALPDIDVAAFERFNEWLYTKTISEEVCREAGLSALQLYNKDTPSLPQLLDVWLLADYLLVPRLQNVVADMMMMKMSRRRVVAPAEFAYVYQRTERGSVMRKLIVDTCVWRSFGGDGAVYQQPLGFLPEEMGEDLLVAFTRRVNKIDSDPLLETYYHVPEAARERREGDGTLARQFMTPTSRPSLNSSRRG